MTTPRNRGRAPQPGDRRSSLSHSARRESSASGRRTTDATSRFRHDDDKRIADRATSVSARDHDHHDHPGNHSGSATHAGHSHSLAEVRVDFAPLAAKVVVGTLIACGIAVIVGIIALWPAQRNFPIPAQLANGQGKAIITDTGDVQSSAVAKCQNSQYVPATSTAPQVTPDPSGLCFESVVRLTSGPDTGKYVQLDIQTNRIPNGTITNAPPQSVDPTRPPKPAPGQPSLAAGDKVKLVREVGTDGQRKYAFFDYQRGTALVTWIAIFVIVIVLVAAWRGFRSIIGLIIAFIILIYFTLPAIVSGESAVAVALVSSAAILFAVIYLAHGFSLRTSAALIGTLAALGAAGILAWVVTHTATITGITEEQNNNMQTAFSNVSLGQILLAGFIIGALGVLNDVTITQASAVFELASANPTQPRRATFTAAMRVGRDHIASTVYTLVFAYAGAALPMLLLYSVSGRSFTDIASYGSVAAEVARSLVGGIALALSVPLTTAVAVLLAKPRTMTSVRRAMSRLGEANEKRPERSLRHAPTSERTPEAPPRAKSTGPLAKNAVRRRDDNAQLPGQREQPTDLRQRQPASTLGDVVTSEPPHPPVQLRRSPTSATPTGHWTGPIKAQRAVPRSGSAAQWGVGKDNHPEPSARPTTGARTYTVNPTRTPTNSFPAQPQHHGQSSPDPTKPSQKSSPPANRHYLPEPDDDAPPYDGHGRHSV